MGATILNILKQSPLVFTAEPTFNSISILNLSSCGTLYNDARADLELEFGGHGEVLLSFSCEKF